MKAAITNTSTCGLISTSSTRETPKLMGRTDYSGHPWTQIGRGCLMPSITPPADLRQSRSITPAIAIPKPRHIEAMP
jgi:hypothetical protein